MNPRKNFRRRLGRRQQLVLADNPQLWIAAVLSDGSCLCLDRDTRALARASLADVDHPGPYILTNNGRVLGIYHYYMQRYGFTFAPPRRQDEPESAANPPGSREFLTPSEAVSYIHKRYGIKRHAVTVRSWVKKNYVDHHSAIRSGHRVWLISRQSLDEGFNSGSLPPQTTQADRHHHQRKEDPDGRS